MRVRLGRVYHGNQTTRTLKELARAYLYLVQDTTRVMNRLKALFRGRGISCAGQQVYQVRHRPGWLEQLREKGVHRRAEFLYQQLDVLQLLRKEARQALLAESRRHPAYRILRSLPWLGPIRVALIIALVHSPIGFAASASFGLTAAWR